MSDVLVDTSAWIEFFNTPNSPCASAVDILLAEHRVCTTSLVIVEVVSGARTQEEFNRLKKDFKALPLFNLSEESWERMMESRWQLKKNGITGISIPDLIIAYVALNHKKAILTLDQDFHRMRIVLDLDLVRIN